MPSSSFSSASLPATSSSSYVCSMCPVSGGALKATDDPSKSWCHLLCALWAPRVVLHELDGNIRITAVDEAIEESNQQYGSSICSICNISYGSLVKCCDHDCSQVFHPYCAWYGGLYMKAEIHETASFTGCNHFLYCEDHTPDSSLTSLPANVISSGQFSQLTPVQRRHYRLILQRDVRNRGRLDHLMRRTKAKKLAQRSNMGRQMTRQPNAAEDLYEAERCAVCFYRDDEIIQQYEELKLKYQVNGDDATTATQKALTSLPYPHDEGVAVRMVRCALCNIDVHQHCMGISDEDALIDGAWLCARCSVINDRDCVCIICQRSGGAFKRTQSGRWCHVACAIWIFDYGLKAEDRYRHIITHEQISKLRKKMKCSFCSRIGLTIMCNQCTEQTFHPTCALLSGCWLMIVRRPTASPLMVCYCKKHTPLHLMRSLPEIPSEYTRLMVMRRQFELVRMLLEQCQKRDKIKHSLLKTSVDIMKEEWELGKRTLRMLPRDRKKWELNQQRRRAIANGLPVPELPQPRRRKTNDDPNAPQTKKKKKDLTMRPLAPAALSPLPPTGSPIDSSFINHVRSPIALSVPQSPSRVPLMAKSPPFSSVPLVASPVHSSVAHATIVRQLNGSVPAEVLVRSPVIRNSPSMYLPPPLAIPPAQSLDDPSIPFNAQRAADVTKQTTRKRKTTEQVATGDPSIIIPASSSSSIPPRPPSTKKSHKKKKPIPINNDDSLNPLSTPSTSNNNNGVADLQTEPKRPKIDETNSTATIVLNDSQTMDISIMDDLSSLKGNSQSPLNPSIDSNPLPTLVSALNSSSPPSDDGRSVADKNRQRMRRTQ